MNTLVRDVLEKTALTLFSAVLFVAFFQLNNWIFASFEYGQGINWVFLPAGFRVILVLVLGLPGALGLMLGSLIIDRELIGQGHYALAVLNGLAGGLSPWLVMKWMIHCRWISPQLQSFNALQLLNMTLLFSAISAVLHQLIWRVLQRPHMNIWVDIWPMFVGNALGSLLMLYAFKFVLDRLALREPMRPD